MYSMADYRDPICNFFFSLPLNHETESYNISRRNDIALKGFTQFTI